MGSSALRKVQLGQQTAFNTPNTTATIIPSGLSGSLEDQSEISFPGDNEFNGLMVADGRHTFKNNMGAISMDGDLTVENVDYILNAGWQAQPTGSTVQTTGKQRIYTSPTTGSKNTPNFFTAQAGDDTQAWQIQDAFATDWELGAAIGGDSTGKMTLLGSTVTPTTFTTSVPRLAATSIPAWMWKIYIDEPGGGVLGTTQAIGVLRNWTSKGTSGFHHKMFQDGTITPSNWGQKRPIVTLDFTLELTTLAVAERAKYKAGTYRLIRLSYVGDQIGAGPARNTINLDFIGKYTKFNKPDDADGNTVISATLKCYYNAVDNTFFKATTINAAASLL